MSPATAGWRSGSGGGAGGTSSRPGADRRRGFITSPPLPPGAEVWEGSRWSAGALGDAAGAGTADQEAVMATVKLTVDGKRVSVNADPSMPLLYALRNDLGLNNPHFGCGLAQGGACTVHLDGEPVRACILPLSLAQGKTVTTLKGLGSPQKPHPLQQAYVEEQVPQCGYCISGWIMTDAAVLRKTPKA